MSLLFYLLKDIIYIVMKNARFYDYIALVIFVIAGSYCVFFATNTFIYDVIDFSKDAFNFWDLILALPHLCLMVEVVGFMLFLIRYLKIDKIYRSHHVKVYSIISVVLSGIGLISTLMSGIFYWNGNFLAAAPYPWSMLVCLVVHSVAFVLAATSVVFNFLVRGSEDERFIYPPSYAFYTVLMNLLIFFVFYRIGALTWSLIWFWFGEYATYGVIEFLIGLPFFLSLLLPLFIGLSISGDKLVIFKKDFFKEHISAWIVYLAIGIVSGAYTITMLIVHENFAKVIGIACPLMVLNNFPIDAIFLIAFNILVPLGYLIYLLVMKKRQLS